MRGSAQWPLRLLQGYRRWWCVSLRRLLQAALRCAGHGGLPLPCCAAAISGARIIARAVASALAARAIPTARGGACRFATSLSASAQGSMMALNYSFLARGMSPTRRTAAYSHCGCHLVVAAAGAQRSYCGSASITSTGDDLGMRWR
jgi:hypothetical protein